MLISHQNHFIFIKSGKTAGTSTEVYFEPACTPPGHKPTHVTDSIVSEFGIVGTRRNMGKLSEKPYWWNHMRAAEMKKKVEPDMWSGYLKFGNIRNPYDRAVSAFLHDRRIKNLDNNVGIDELRDAFEAYVMGPGAGFNKAFFFIDDEMILDEVIRYESLSDDIFRVAERVGYRPNDWPIPHLKKRDDQHAQRVTAEYYTDAGAARIRELDGWVFQHFGYSTALEDA